MRFLLWCCLGISLVLLTGIAVLYYSYNEKANLEKDFKFNYSDYEKNFSKVQSTHKNGNSQNSPSYLIFSDNSTKCKVNGKVFINGNEVGSTINGEFKLTNGLLEIEEAKIKLNGNTDSCFGKNSNLPFVGEWEYPSFKKYFSPGRNLSLLFFSNPREPNDYVQMQGFVRPSETKDYLDKELRKYFKNDTYYDLGYIFKIFVPQYVTDIQQFGTEEYWQTPAEVIKGNSGDCEDWAVTTLSIMREYNPNIKCYNSIWPTHLSVFCYYDKRFIIYDQGGTISEVTLLPNDGSSMVIQDNKIRIRTMLSNYFDDYGLQADERRLYALFNDKEVIEFNDTENFVDWALKLNS